MNNAGHDLVIVNGVGLNGSSDEIIFNYAIAENRILITHNCNDFKGLHEINLIHPGNLAIYRERNNAKNLSRKDIVRSNSFWLRLRLPPISQPLKFQFPTSLLFSITEIINK